MTKTKTNQKELSLFKGDERSEAKLNVVEGVIESFQIILILLPPPVSHRIHYATLVPLKEGQCLLKCITNP